MTEKFHYSTLEALQTRLRELDLSLPFAKSTAILGTPLSFGDHTVPNRLGIAPMEGADSLSDGSPSKMTTQRYVKDAQGGSAIIWFEAISIVPEGRSSVAQLFLSEENLSSYQKFTQTIREAGRKANGYEPYLIMQANHSGRYSNPCNKPAPLIAYRNPELETYRTADDTCIVSDDYLQRLEEQFGKAALLAKKAGFDAIDIKSCHGYLLAELLSAYTRKGRYGGPYENRTRFLKNAIRAAKVQEDSDFMVTCRLGLYDGFPYPYGFGVRDGSGLCPDLSEPLQLVQELYYEEGLSMLDLTMGNPYVTTHITRPYDKGKYEPDEHPLRSLERMIHGIGEVKRAVSGCMIYGSAPSYLRQYADLYAAGAVEQGYCDGMLFGRMSFANPDFAHQIIQNGRVDPSKVCLTCGKCGDLVRSHLPSGCVVRHPEIYLPYYREYLAAKDTLPENFRG